MSHIKQIFLAHKITMDALLKCFLWVLSMYVFVEKLEKYLAG